MQTIRIVGEWCGYLYRALKRRWYRLKCRAWYRYTTIKPRELDHEWHDRDTLIPYCMFEILQQFIELELDGGDGGVVDWQADEPHRRAHAELMELYRWWREEYLQRDRHAGLFARWCKTSWDVSASVWSRKDPTRSAYFDNEDVVNSCIDDTMNGELERRCKRLIDVMGFMWT